MIYNICKIKNHVIYSWIRRWIQFVFDLLSFSRVWWTKYLKNILLLWWIRSYFLVVFPFFVWEAMKLKTSVSISIFFYWLYLIIEKDLYSFFVDNAILRWFGINVNPSSYMWGRGCWCFSFLCTLLIVMCWIFRWNFFGRPRRFGNMLYYLFCNFYIQLYKPSLNKSPPKML